MNRASRHLRIALRNLRARFSHRSASVAIIALGVLLALPSIAVGFFADDYTFLVALRRGARPFFDLFRFSSGDTGANRLLVASGDYPWWTAPDFKLHFIRPLTSIVFSLDAALFGNHPLGYHLDTLVWYLALLVGARLFFRRVLSPRAATLALLVFTLRSGHVLPYAWISARHVLIAAVPALFALLAHMRAVRDDWKPGRIVAPILFVLGLMGSEIALGIVPFWVAYDAGEARRAGGVRRFAGSCAPVVVLTALYLASYRLLGGGASSAGSYENPLNHPAAFVLAAASRMPAYLGDALLGFPVGLTTDASPWVMAVVGAAGIFLCTALFAASRTARDPDRATLAWVLPAAFLALGPGLSTLWGHALLVPDLGFSALIGYLLGRAFAAVASGSGVAVAKYGMALGGAVLFVGHIVVAPLASAQATWRMIVSGRADANTAMTAELGPPPAKVFLMAAPDAATYFYARDVVEALAPERLKCWSPLAAASAPYRLTRTGSQAFRLEQTARSTADGYEHFFSARAFAVGDEVQSCGARIRVEALRDGAPSALRVDLGEPLESDDLALLVLEDRRLRRFPLPAIGESADLPGRLAPVPAQRGETISRR